MSMVVRTNTMAMTALRNLNSNQSAVSSSLQKLSSGYQINSAADDASGLAMSEKMQSQIAGLDQASSNAQDGISLVQTASGATDQIQSMLNRMVELATKSASGTVQDDDREAIQSEVDALNSEITTIAKSTDFNGINLLDGSLSTSSGSNVASTITTDLAYTTTAATKGSFTASAITASTFTEKGDTMTMTLSLDDGTSSTVTLTEKVDDNGNYYLEDSNGNTTSLASASATTAEVASALQTAYDEEVGGKFTVSLDSTTNEIKFTALNAGTDAAQVTGLSYSTYDKTANASTGLTYVSATASVQADDGSTNIAASSITMYDGTNLTASEFTIDGQKFVVANSSTDVSSLSSDVHVLYTTTADSVATALSSTASKTTIENATGLTVDFNSTSGNLELSTALADTSGQGLTLQIGSTSDSYNQVTVSIDNLTAAGLGTSGLDVSSQDAAKSAIDTINDAISTVSENQSNLGALENRLDYTIDNLDNTSENLSSANSAIRDTDMATEMMKYTQANTLLQAAQSMLAQANSAPQSVLQLLQG